MEEQKRLRLAAAITVNLILLIAILTAVIIYQLASIAAVNRQRNAIKNEIAQYEELLKNGQKDLDYLKSEQFLLDKAFELGYYFPND